MATNMILRINETANDNDYSSQPSYYIDVDPNNDNFIFSAGSVDVADGQPIPNEDQLNRAGTLLGGSNPIEVDKYFLADNSVNLLKEINLAGSNAKRYVFCASFDGATATEPQLEVWDNLDMNSYSILCLGAGTPNNSWYFAICTTDSAPVLDWTGTPLAGSGGSNIVLLNNVAGALTGAKDLYFNFKIIIPASYDNPGIFTPVIAITYTTN